VRDEALRLGAVAYIEKPFSTDALLQQVRLRLLALEVAGTASTGDDINAMESRWIAKLQSREMGLNRNG